MILTAQNLKWYGRNFDYEGIRYFDFSASGFEFCFTGKKAVATVLSDPQNHAETNKGVIGVFVKEITSPADYKNQSYWNNLAETEPVRIVLKDKENTCTLYESAKEKTVVIKVIKISEAAFGNAGLKQIEIDGNQVSPSGEEPEAVKMEIIGDSITCGYGIDGVWNKDTFTTETERVDKAYSFLTAKELKADFQLCSWSGIGLISKYVDPSVEVPDTTISMPLLWPYTDRSTQLRLNVEPTVYDCNCFNPDIVVIHLGTNDASFVRKNEDRRVLYVHALRVFMEEVHRRRPNAKICCCLGVMGQELCDSVEEAVKLFSKDFPAVATKYVKFPVQDEKDGIAADWHPSAVSHKKVAAQLSAALKEWC